MEAVRPSLDDDGEQPDQVGGLHHRLLLVPAGAESERGEHDVQDEKNEHDLDDALEGLEAEEEEARLVDLPR